MYVRKCLDAGGCDLHNSSRGRARRLDRARDGAHGHQRRRHRNVAAQPLCERLCRAQRRRRHGGRKRHRLQPLLPPPRARAAPLRQRSGDQARPLPAPRRRARRRLCRHDRHAVAPLRRHCSVPQTHRRARRSHAPLRVRSLPRRQGAHGNRNPRRAVNRRRRKKRLARDRESLHFQQTSSPRSQQQPNTNITTEDGEEEVVEEAFFGMRASMQRSRQQSRAQTQRQQNVPPSPPRPALRRRRVARTATPIPTPLAEKDPHPNHLVA
mmetsp:Transcript_9722/g.31820  ORF Transcript_9722/g.31820 Transcript_9722/m.31820 type:complete len:267 (-) Transcript_9722:183-983(-)